MRLIIAASLILAAGAAGSFFGMRRPTPIQARPFASPIVGPRLRYPDDHYPVLTLPDGSQRSVKSLLRHDRPLKYGDYLWDDAAVPAGPVWVRIDLGLQTLSIFRGGHEIGSTVILYGVNSKPTPPGIYPILERATHHRSTLYDAEMPYMLRLTGDGVAIHASDVRAGRATHGCIGVPLAFARLLFAEVKKGDPVAIIKPNVLS